MAECTCGYDHVNDDEHRPDCGKHSLPPLLVRIEYEIPPTRAIYSVWYEDLKDEPEDLYRRSFAENHPKGRIRKIERGLPRIVAEGEAFHNG